jgi:hypothetical protein
MVNNCLQVLCDKQPKVKFAGRHFQFSTGMFVGAGEYVAIIYFSSHDIRCGLTARISRFHRGGRGSIPRTGTSSFAFFGHKSSTNIFCVQSTSDGSLFLASAKP